MAIMGMVEEVNGSIPVVLQVDMHCRCDGCLDKIKDGMNSIKDFEGVERIWKDYSSGMITVFGSMDPQKLRDKLHSKTRKTVSIVFRPTGREPQVGNPSQVMPLGSIIPSSDHGYGLPSAPPLSEMSNSIVAVQPNDEVLWLRENRTRDAERIRKLEEELEYCRRVIREIYMENN
ncbi:heavy metal-associated isoprenylated plant protein 5-like [Typha latifolia]|uniref:heavy metal-associated isoprenylated plant protein 5-like n=1 Tax=Typha latifolia TaxID=4733 RepID=UPI003C2AB85F